jgi:hypothetical protein
MQVVATAEPSVDRRDDRGGEGERGGGAGR